MRVLRGWEVEAIFFYLGGGILGCLGRPTRGVGKRYTSSVDHDPRPAKILERSALSVKIHRPDTLAAEE